MSHENTLALLKEKVPQNAGNRISEVLDFKTPLIQTQRYSQEENSNPKIYMYCSCHNIKIVHKS